MRLVAALVVVLLGAHLAGAITLQHPGGTGAFDVEESEVQLRSLAPGSTVSTNGTDATVSVLGALTSTTTSVLYLDNLNTTGTYVARLSLASSDGLANVLAATIGIDNGTQVPQVVVSLGTVTQSGGTHVVLAPGSTNTIYITQTVAILSVGSSFTLDVINADDVGEGVTETTQAVVSLT